MTPRTRSLRGRGVDDDPEVVPGVMQAVIVTRLAPLVLTLTDPLRIDPPEQVALCQASMLEFKPPLPV